MMLVGSYLPEDVRFSSIRAYRFSLNIRRDAIGFEQPPP
jgi:hypothetical protein